MGSRNFKDNLWIFGDSFVAINANWVHDLSIKCKSRVQHLGYGGSSVQFLLIDLLRYMPLIQPNDRVVIAITSPSRFYLKSKHYHSFLKLNSSYYERKKYKDLEIQAMTNYLDQLYDPHQDDLYKGAIVSQVIHQIIPALNTNLVQYIFSIHDQAYTQKHGTFVHRRDNEPPPLLVTAQNFIRKYEPEGYDREKDNIIELIQDPPNHWLDHPEYYNYFWGTYDKYFEHLYNSPSII